MTVTIYGRDTTNNEPHYGEVLIGQMRLCVFDPTAFNMWIYELRAFMGRASASGTARAKLVVYDTDAAKDPYTFLGRTSQINMTTTMLDALSGDEFSASIADAPTSPTDSAIAAWSNRRLAIGINNLSTSDRIVGHSMKQAVELPSGTDNKNFYDINSAGDPPETTLESSDYVEHYEGHLTICAVADINTAPLVPTSLGPVGAVSEVTPTFTGSFRDLNGNYGPGNGGADRGDALNRVRIKVYTDALRTNNIWNFEYAASPAEIAADAFSRVYGGSALTRGVTYYWVAQVSDYFGAWSLETAVQSFSPASLGTVTLDGTPNGKTDDLTPDFQFKWTHASSLSTNAVQIRLYRNGTFLKESPIITKTVASSAAPGTLGTITAAESTFGNLDPGQNYQYTVRGRDTNNQWSAWPNPASSGWRTFTTDHAPTIPTRVSPVNGAILLALPTVIFKSTDADDTVGTGLVGYVRVKTKENIDNPTFESNILSWGVHAANSVTVSASRDASIFSDAAGSLRLNVTAGSSPNEYQYASTDFLLCVPGEIYSFTAMGRKDHATDIDIRMGILFEQADGTDISISWGDYGADTAGSFLSLGVTATSPALSARARIVFGVKCMVTIGTARNAYFDAITPVNAQVRAIIPATQNGDNWEAAGITTDEVPTYMQVWWDGYTYDGTVYSGGSTTTPQYMSEATFIWADGPDVTVTSPTADEVLTINTPFFDWDDVPNQTHVRIQSWDAGTDDSRWDTGWVSHVDSDWVTSAGIFHNGDAIDYTISVRDNLGLEGTSAVRSFTIDLVPPDPHTNVTLVPLALALSPWEDVFRIAWEESLHPDFWSTIITAYESNNGPSTAKVLFETFAASDVVFIHRFPKSGVEYTYNVYQIVNNNGDLLESDPTELIGSISITGASLIDVRDPSGMTRASFAFMEKLQYDFEQGQQEYETWGKNKAVSILGKVKTWNVPSRYFLVTHEAATSKQQADQLMHLAEFGSGLYGYRDDEGHLFFLKINKGPKITVEEVDWYTVDMDLRQQYYVEEIR